MLWHGDCVIHSILSCEKRLSSYNNLRTTEIICFRFGTGSFTNVCQHVLVIIKSGQQCWGLSVKTCLCFCMLTHSRNCCVKARSPGKRTVPGQPPVVPSVSIHVL
jgi:hypothetical protein